MPAQPDPKCPSCERVVEQPVTYLYAEVYGVGGDLTIVALLCPHCGAILGFTPRGA